VIILYVVLLVIFAGLLGLFVGFRLRDQTYHGVIKLVENNGKLVYSLELHFDPDLLVFQKDVRFKVIPPDYENLLSQ
jgi:hypothetical protein